MYTQNQSSRTTQADLNPLNAYTEYGGIFKMEKRIVMFSGHTVPLHNIAQVLSYPVKPKYFLSVLHIIIASAAVIFFFNGYAEVKKISDSASSIPLLLALCCLGLLGYAFYERTRSPLFGFTIELTSGNYYPIVHKNKRFIDDIYNGFTVAIRESKDFEANFENLTINQGKYAGITGSTIVDGDNYGAVKGGDYHEDASVGG